MGLPAGRPRQLLFDGSPLLASAIYADDDGALRAGRDAVRAARLDPTRYEPNPKRRIDDLEVLLGERVYPVAELIATTLRRVRDEAVRTVGQPPGRIIVTHPAAWGAARRAILVEACARAGLPDPVLVAEPVAAATHFAALPEIRVEPGQAVVVYDLGAGTLDISVVRSSGDRFDTLAYRGLDDIGGLDFDALVIAHAGRGLGDGHAEAWQRVVHPQTAEDRRSHRLLWDDAREAKEALSRQNTVSYPLPGVGHDAMITRAEFEAVAGPLIARTVEVTLAAIRDSGVRADQIAGLFLVGGGSRMPLVATLLHQRCGIAPTALEQPELVVAEGALAAVPAAAAGPAPQPSPVHAAVPVSGPSQGPPPPRVHAALPPEQAWPSAPPTRQRRSGQEPRPEEPRQPEPQVQQMPPSPPVWPAEATALGRPGPGPSPGKAKLWWLVPPAVIVLVLALGLYERPVPLAGLAVLGLIAAIVMMRRRRRASTRR